MNVLLVSIDSLNRHFLDVYGQPIDLDVATPNLDRFAERAAVFDTHYAGSLPCMPARREWLTGTQEFLWRPWGPAEPFDTVLPGAAQGAGVMTRLVTDHYHYFEHGSGGYFEEFNAFEFVRGHEADSWQNTPREPDERLLEQIGARDVDSTARKTRTVYSRNVDSFDELDETDFFGPKVFSTTADWLRENAADGWDDWFCYVDSFDVHEPFHCPEPYASMYTDEDPTDPELTSWPYYGRIDEGQSELTERQLEFARAQFAGKTTMVDRWFGRVLDAFDREELWEDTMLVVTADHGHFLGEHGWIGKPYKAPLYDVLAHTPLLIWHPESPRTGDSVTELTAAVDLYATVLDALDVDVESTRHSRSLLPLLDGETSGHREWALYGYWGSSVNVTDGEYTYLHPCDPDSETYCYSSMMMNPYGWFSSPEPQPAAESGDFLPYADVPVWRYPAESNRRHSASLLFDVANDPRQEADLDDPDQRERMQSLLVDAMESLDAPSEQFDRLGLDA
jgi:arylsulfatase A-like enzyme